MIDKQYKKNRRRSILGLILLFAIIILINFLASGLFFRFDLTEEKRFSVSEPTKVLLEKQEDIIFVRVYLAGDLTPNLQKHQHRPQENAASR